MPWPQKIVIFYLHAFNKLITQLNPLQPQKTTFKNLNIQYPSTIHEFTISATQKIIHNFHYTVWMWNKLLIMKRSASQNKTGKYNKVYTFYGTFGLSFFLPPIFHDFYKWSTLIMMTPFYDYDNSKRCTKRKEATTWNIKGYKIYAQ